MNNMETAFREAGHVVMTLLWGVWRVNRVCMAGMDRPDDGTEYAPVREMEENEPGRLSGSRSLDAKLERVIAGPVAEAIFRGREVSYPGGSVAPDFDYLVGAIQESSPGGSLAEARAAINEHTQVVQADLKRMWPVVEALAHELMHKKELLDPEIRSIVRIAVNKLPDDEKAWAISRLRNAPPRSSP
ncbi:MAG TPA: hypothetical protein VK900_02760 [Anaerolineales bacterium]|nr:hypothetical protein [Anaerolineales bacterium]